jgi:enediyne biosynthesis protein E2
VVFAAKARAYSGVVPDHTQAACSALTDISVDKAVSLADDTAVTTGTGSEPAYELWRQRIRAHFTAE